MSPEAAGPGSIRATRIGVFQKHYRGRQGSAGVGLGLGLTICRAIVPRPARRERIWLRNRDERGSPRQRGAPRFVAPPPSRIAT